MKICFINPPFKAEYGKFSRESRSPSIGHSGVLYYPLWLIYAACVAEKNGFDVAFIDAPAKQMNKEQTIERVKKEAADAKLFVFDTSTPSIYSDVEFAGTIKKMYPNAFTMLVGTHPSATPDETMGISELIDGLARHEYDYIVRDTAVALRDGADLATVRGLTYRKDGEVVHNPDAEHKKNTGQLPQYYIENYHEGIVSKQMFREVQAEIARRNSKSAANQRKHRRGRYNSKYALSERLFCGDCGSPYKRVTWNIHGRKQIVWRCVNRIEYGTKFCGSSPSIPEEELHRAILKAVQGLAANFTDEVAAQINGILHNIQTGESTMPNLQEQLEQTQQEFDRLLEMSLDFDEDTPFLDDRLKKLNNKIKSLKKAIEDSTARQEKVSQPEMLLSAKDLQIQEYDDTLTARIIEKITVRARNEIEIRFIGGYKKTMRLA